MRTIETVVYNFDELSEEAKKKAIESMADINVDYEWYEFIYEFDKELDTLEYNFQQSLSEDYLSMLKKEYEYKTSEEAIIETIKANDYEFTEDGKLV